MEINLYKLKPRCEALLLCLILLILLSLPIVYLLHQYDDPNSSLYKDVIFQLYIPIRLPSGIKITDKFLIADMPNIHGIWYSWFIWLKPIDWDFHVAISKNSGEGIIEWKAKGVYPASLLSLNCAKYNQASGSCEIRMTPKGQRYEYLDSQSIVFGSTPNEEEINLIKGNTLINTSIFIKNNTPISQPEWDNFIDSFVPINADVVPFGHKSPGVNVI